MAESVSVNKQLPLKDKYKTLFDQLRVLLDRNDNILSNLSNFTAALKEVFDKISWVGFYIYDGEKLYLGPFQGKVACTQISMGKGVCGTAAETRSTVIVPDVNEFPGHIACDADSKSEIVVPVLKNNELWGVLDLDSTEYSAFDQTDQYYLEQYCKYLSEEIIG